MSESKKGLVKIELGSDKNSSRGSQVLSNKYFLSDFDKVSHIFTVQEVSASGKKFAFYCYAFLVNLDLRHHDASFIILFSTKKPTSTIVN